MKVFTILLLSMVCSSQAAIHLSSLLTSSEQQNIKGLFETTPYSDVSNAHFSVQGLRLLSQGGALPSAVTKAACEAAKAANTKSLESVFYISSIISALGATCKYQIPASSIESVSKKVAADTDIKSFYQAVTILTNVGKKVSTKDAVAHLTSILANDDSVYSSSLAILTAVQLEVTEDLKPLLEKVLDLEDMVAQADEVEDKYLHFENDLRTTSTFIRAAYELAAKTKSQIGISEEQIILLANYILRTKNPTGYEQSYNVIAPLSAIASYKAQKVAKVQLLSGNAVSQEKSVVRVSVSDVLGLPVEGLTVKADSVTRTSDNEVIISNVPLKKSIAASTTMYELNMWDLKPKSGFYDITLNVVSTSGASLAGTSEVEFRVKVTTKVAILDAQIGTQERESTTAEWKRVQHPNKAGKLKADSQEKVVMTFKVQDTMDKTMMKPHQVFILFQNVESDQEVIFIAEPDSSSTYKFEVDLYSASKEQFAGKGGDYTVQVIIGDAAISNPILWHVADISLSFPSATPAAPSESIYATRPEIKHMFRESEKRPPAVVSTVFTFACLAPLVILLISWAKTGANLSNMSLAPKNIIFHAGLTGIFVLYYFFWVQLNMFTTIRYLVLLGAITFLAGSKVLSDNATQ